MAPASTSIPGERGPDPHPSSPCLKLVNQCLPIYPWHFLSCFLCAGAQSEPFRPAVPRSAAALSHSPLGSHSPMLWGLRFQTLVPRLGSWVGALDPFSAGASTVRISLHVLGGRTVGMGPAHPCPCPSVSVDVASCLSPWLEDSAQLVFKWFLVAGVSLVVILM